ncbi:MAG: 7-cyano-7-deazaguanine synthase [Gemmataceae bacterium]
MDSSQSLAVLVSGGLDSAILLAESCQSHDRVHPIYIRFGLKWEPVELQYLRRFLDELKSPALRSLTILDMPVQDLYGNHWSLTGQGTPGADTPDEAVFLPGRNVLFLVKAMLWCERNQVPTVALAPLGSNPFPDASPEFFRDFERIVNQAIAGKVRVVRPYETLHKVDVLNRGRSFPLRWTFSCIHPVDGLHCGQCNKCAERQHGFAQARLPDPTSYARRS